MPLRLGTRRSALAQWQAEWVASQLRARGIEIQLTPITTTGDRQQGAIARIGEQGIFTKQIQYALLDGRIDLAVHSLKDLPTDVAPGLALAAVPERAAAGDVLVSPQFGSFDALPHGAHIGTGSLRRRAQLLHVRRDLRMEDVRGNVETRLQKLQQGDFDALILAEAGLRRLGLDQHIAQVLPLELILPAVGQGALGVEARCDDDATLSIAAFLDHAPTHAAVLAERAMLSALQGGCLAPIAALASVEGGQLTLRGRVIGRDGNDLLDSKCSGTAFEAVGIGRRLAKTLLAQGAGSLIDASREA